MPAWFEEVLSVPESRYVARIVVALLLGGIVGLERELHDKPAGFRTIILICVGACLFTILSLSLSVPGVDAARIAAQVVTGIGFLGAGAIVRGRRKMHGLTTAATIWAVAAIGMAVGFGQHLLAASGTGLILLTLQGFNAVEGIIGRRRDIQEFVFRAALRENLTRHIEEMFSSRKLRIIGLRYYEVGADVVFTVRAMGPKSQHRRLRQDLLFDKTYKLIKE